MSTPLFKNPHLAHTSSSVGAYLACPRRFQWAYEYGIRRVSDGLRTSVGTAYHLGLELLNNGATLDMAVMAARAGFGDSDEAKPADREKAACLIAGWNWRWSEAPAFKKILATEQVFEFRPVKHARWTWAGKIDVIGELDDGNVAVGEYKTTTEPISPTPEKPDAGGQYWSRLLIDRQISGYLHGARSLGFPATKVLYDVARVPANKPKLLTKKEIQQAAMRGDVPDLPAGGGSAPAEEAIRPRESMEQFATRLMGEIEARPDYYFARREIPRTDADLAESIEDMVHFAAMIGWSRGKGRFPRNTDSCRKWGLCPFFGPCTASWNVEEQGLPGGYKKVENCHVELTIEEEPAHAEPE